MTNLLTLDRRYAIKLLFAAGAASSVSGCGDAPQTQKNTQKSTQKPVRKLLSVQEMELLTALAGTIIPATETPGAIEAGVPDTINELLKNWGADDLRLYWFNGLASIQSYFKKELSGKSFARLSNAQRLSALASYDSAVYSGEVDNPFYKDAKLTIATAYYMSEIGADEELIYDPVPGDFKGCIPFDDVGRAWAI